MARRFVLTTLVVGLLGTVARAQNIYVGPGSTLEGDYLRGVGVAAYGMGVYNEKNGARRSNQRQYVHDLERVLRRRLQE